MAGNTRGKLKEHFEGVHRNLDWCIHHTNASIRLLDTKLRDIQLDEKTRLSAEDLVKYMAEYPLVKGITALAEGIKTLDGLAQEIYNSF